MRKIKLSLLVAAPIVTLLACLALSTDQEAESKSFLIGNTYAFQYYPADETNSEQKAITKYMNSLNISAQFVNDSIFILRTNEQINNANWSILGDSINLGGLNYLLTTTGQSILLLSENERLELTPIF